ncbi:MAG TPA: hypothetical protein PLS79_14515 [Caldilinea sp.]|nr:hypothetical protein [Caldilinea sp.]HRA64692.1 hypothetical protein [Caldilinea sp.]
MAITRFTVAQLVHARASVCAWTLPARLTTRLTVAVETPARRATSTMVTRRGSSFWDTGNSGRHG